ncbi:MAG: endonuclease/exonuclease/phosphatase family protein [Treponema sp.]|nr:endonuclease/exonuclease/phosphatase family protein [Treponema sp.]
MTRPKWLRLPALLLVLIAALAGCGGQGEGKSAETEETSLTIMSWNLQLLFDGTEDGTEYAEFRESAGWNREKYMARLNAIAGALAELDSPPDVIAMQEIESARVVADLASALPNLGYNWAYFAGKPGMALGIGLISRFPVERAVSHSAFIEGDLIPRPVLEVEVRVREAGGEGRAEESGSVLLFVCHWKSKLGGEDKTESTRMASARVILRRIRELAELRPELPVIVVGDLNINHDEFLKGGGLAMKSLVPDSRAAAELALAYRPAGIPRSGQRDFIVISHEKPPAARHFPAGTVALYSPWTVEKSGGSYFFRNSWETIDHFLLSPRFFGPAGWEFVDSRVLDVRPFVDQAGKPNAYNPRTGRGLSDHLPIMLVLRLPE